MGHGSIMFRNLNHDGRWPGFHWEGLELGEDGVLRLSALPRLEAPPPPQLGSAPSHVAAAAVAVDSDGDIYFADSSCGHLRRVMACTGEPEVVTCLGRSPLPGQHRSPAALAAPRSRRVLLAADPDAHEVRAFSLDTMQLVEVLGDFESPIALACDSTGRTYVIDRARRRVDQLTPTGDLVPSFWESMFGAVSDPRLVAVDDDRIFVLDASSQAVTAFDTEGAHIETVDPSIASVTALAVVAGVIYLGDGDRRRIAVFRRGQDGVYARAGDADGYEGAVGALATDDRGGLVAAPGSGLLPLRLTIDASHRTSGVLWGGPIEVDDLAHRWGRLHATSEVPAETHLQFYVYTGPGEPPAPDNAAGFAPPWRAAGSDGSDLFIGGEARSVWIGVAFSNSGHATPSLAQLRVEFDPESYLPFLPSIYREQGDDFLLRFLSLFESFFQELEAHIMDLPALLRPEGAPAAALPWLAGFLALDLPEPWDEGRKRAWIADAYERYARRGTVSGLRECLEAEAGVRAVVDEPIASAGWWCMPAPAGGCDCGGAAWDGAAGSELGRSTMLAGSEPQGAVVGTTATLDRSQLTGAGEFGACMFDALAHRFTVRLYPSDAQCSKKLAKVESIILREKPAHTCHEVCVISPGLRVGYQARLGIDTLLGGGPVPGRLGEGALVLAGQGRGRIGSSSAVGVTTRV